MSMLPAFSTTTSRWSSSDNLAKKIFVYLANEIIVCLPVSLTSLSASGGWVSLPVARSRKRIGPTMCGLRTLWYSPASDDQRGPIAREGERIDSR